MILRILTFLSVLVFVQQLCSQNITLRPQPGKMVCVVTVNNFEGQKFALGIPETIGSNEGTLLNFPNVDISWEGPDRNGICEHTWITERKIEYTARFIPKDDHVDVEMTVKNLSGSDWHSVFSFNCLNPVAAPSFKDWNLIRTYMSKNKKPFRMNGAERINNGNMKTVQFFVNENYPVVSPFVTGFRATSPDKTDDSFIITLSEDGKSYMAATSPKSQFLFDNLDRCCIHSATDFGDIPAGGQSTVTSRFYFAFGGLDDFLKRFNSEVKKKNKPRTAMCWANPWQLIDTTKWQFVYNNLDILKFYIGNTKINRMDRDSAKKFIELLLKEDIKIAIELGGLLDWHADKKDQSAEFSFNQDYNNLLDIRGLIREIDPSRNIDIIDMDGPIRRMLFPKPENKKQDFHTIESAVHELFEVIKLWRDTVPGIEINLLTNFPNWAWGDTPAYFKIDNRPNGYGYYIEVLNAIKAKAEKTGLNFNGLTVDNPYDYATGAANTNQPGLIRNVDWMQRLDELDSVVKDMGWNLNMIFNTNGGRDAKAYSDQTLEFIDLYHQRVGEPDGYWIQSWYDLPGSWQPETEDYTMTNLTKNAIMKIRNITDVEEHQERESSGVGISVFPNPFSEFSIFSFQFLKPGNFELRIYNALGVEVTELVKGFYEEGVYQVEFDGSSLAAGVYYYVMSVGGTVESGQIVLVR